MSGGPDSVDGRQPTRYRKGGRPAARNVRFRAGGVLRQLYARKRQVRDTALETRVRAHTRDHLAACLTAWAETPALTEGSRPPGGEHRLVHLAGRVQPSRIFARLLGDEHAETVAVALETLLTLILEGDLVYAGAVRKAVHAGRDSLTAALPACLAPAAPGADASPPAAADGSAPLRRQLVEAVHASLAAIRDVTAASAYGGPCVAFPVQHDGGDDTPLRLRGFDLYRMEMENLRLFLLEMPWKNVETRSNGLTGLLENAARNGHVFDARAALTAAPEQEAVLRLLYGSSLDPDFLELLLQAPAWRIHPVNPILVRRYRPSWGLPEDGGRKSPAPLSDRLCEPRKSVEELAAEYTQALNAMFRAARQASRDERLPDALL